MRLSNNTIHWLGLALLMVSLFWLAACTPTESAATTTPSVEQVATELMATSLAELPAEVPTETAAAERPTETAAAERPTETAAAETVATETPTHVPTPAATETPFVPTHVPLVTATLLVCPYLPPVVETPPRQEPLRVIYMNEDNLWLWREDDATIKPLTRHGAGGPTVRFMPDKSSIALIQGAGDLWLWRDNGTEATRLTDDGHLVFFYPSDDGAVFALTRIVDQYHEEIWAINSDGSNLRQLVSVEDFTEMGAHPDAALAQMTADGSLATTGTYLTTFPVGLQWIPGSHTLTFDTAPGIELFNPDGIGSPPDDNTLWGLDVDSGERSLILPPGRAGGPYWGSVSFAPDGRTLAVVSNTGISLANSDGTNRHDDLITYPSIGLGHTSYTPPIYWSADSQFLRTIIPDDAEIFGAQDPSFTIWQISVDGTATPLGTLHGFPLDVTLSPDLAQVAFWKPVTPGSNMRQLHIASVDGAWDIVYASGDSLEFKGWSPDSRHFVYWFFNEQRPYLGRLCAEAVPLVEPALEGWSAVTWIDPQRFLLFSGEEGNWTLSLGTPGGTAVPLAQMDAPYYQWNK